MSSAQTVTTLDAMLLLTEKRTDVDIFQARMALEVRYTLRPLGFSLDPSTWEESVEEVLNALNSEYRHEAKVDITENARKIRGKQGLDELVVALVEGVRLYDVTEQGVEELQALYLFQKSRLRPAERFQYEDALFTLRNSLDVIKRQLTLSREKMNQFKTIFRLMDRPVAEMRALVHPLTCAHSQRQNADAAKPLLARLSVLQEERSHLENRAGTVYAMIGALFMSTELDTLTRDTVDTQVARLTSIHQTLEEQAVEQGEILSVLQRIFGAASSTPTTLPSGAPGGAGVSIAEMRKAFKAFMEIQDAVDTLFEVQGPLSAALVRLNDQLTARSVFNSPVVSV